MKCMKSHFDSPTFIELRKNNGWYKNNPGYVMYMAEFQVDQMTVQSLHGDILKSPVLFFFMRERPHKPLSKAELLTDHIYNH